MRVHPGSVLVCHEPSCGAVLQVSVPSAIGTSYRCACGQLLQLERDDRDAGRLSAGSDPG